MKGTKNMKMDKGEKRNDVDDKVSYSTTMDKHQEQSSNIDVTSSNLLNVVARSSTFNKQDNGIVPSSDIYNESPPPLQSEGSIFGFGPVGILIEAPNLIEHGKVKDEDEKKNMGEKDIKKKEC